MKRLKLLVLIVIAMIVAVACAPVSTPVPTQAPPTSAPKPTEAPKATAAPAQATATSSTATTAPKATEAPKASAAWPTKDFTFIVPFSPGGGYDTQARIVQGVWLKYLSKKVNIVVENKSGAGGKIGSLVVMKAAPDGNTVGLLSPASLALMQAGGELETLDIRKLTWLGQFSWDPGVVVVSTSSGFKTPKDLLSREIRIGVTGDSLFSNALLAKKMGLKARMVTFDGSPDQVLAAMRGDVDVMMDSWPSMKKAVDNSGGKLEPLFLVSDKRQNGWSSVPSSKELGLDLGDLQPIAGSARLAAAPANVPPDIAKAMQESLWSALQDPDYKAAMEKAGYDASGIANGVDAAKTVQTLMNVLEQNKDVLDSLKK